MKELRLLVLRSTVTDDFLREWLIRSVTVRNATLLEIVGRHFNLHAISRQDTDAVDAHATGQGAEELVSFRLEREDPDAESGIRKRFFDDAYELDDVLSQNREKSR